MSERKYPKTNVNYYCKFGKNIQLNQDIKKLNPVTHVHKTNYVLTPINPIININNIKINKNQPNDFLHPQKKNIENNTMLDINKIISIKEIEKKSRKSITPAPNNKKKIDLEKEITNKEPKIADIPNKINIDNNFKISKVQNKHNLYINSINENRLPKELKLTDISFDNNKDK